MRRDRQTGLQRGLRPLIVIKPQGRGQRLAGRLCSALALIAVLNLGAVGMLPLCAHAEERIQVELSAPAGGAAAGSGSTMLALPGEPAPIRLDTAVSQLQTVPIFKEGKPAGEFSFRLNRVNSADGKRGYFILPSAGADAALQIFGVLAQPNAAAGEGAFDAFYEISPASGPASPSGSPHEAVRIGSGELASVRGAAAESNAPDAIALPPHAEAASGNMVEAPLLLAEGALWREIEVAVDASEDFIDGRSLEEAAAQIAVMIAGSNLFFEAAKLRLKLSGIDFRGAEAETPYGEALARKDALALLQAAQGHWANRDLPQRDVVVVIAASRFGSFFGLAYPSTSCLIPAYSVLFATQGGDSASRVVGLAATVAHEIGHIIGMSHDSTGSTIMAPYYAGNPAPFSAHSINEFELFAERGGADCLAQIEAPGDTAGSGALLSFVDGAEQQVSLTEGSVYQHIYQVQGAPGGVYLRASGLPAGAAFDPFSGSFFFAPGYLSASRSFPLQNYEVLIEAFSGNQAAALRLLLNVSDVNRAPEIVFSGPEQVMVEEGSVFRLAASVLDPDAGDTPVLNFLNQRTFERLPGKKQITAGASVLNLAWTLPTGFRRPATLLFRGTDAAGAAAIRTVVVSPAPRNYAPEAVLASSPVLTPENRYKLSVRLTDRDGSPVAADVLGLPAGAVVSHSPGGLQIQFPAAEQQKTRIAVSASDGSKTSRTEFDLSFASAAAGAQQPGAAWPGTAGRRTGSSVARAAQFYEASTGMWKTVDCSGRRREDLQFGGLVGDVPLSFLQAGQRREAIFRSLFGQGYWFVRGADAHPEPWGLPGDIPVAGDFDGDSNSDFSVYAPLLNEWRIRFSAMPSQTLRDTAFGPSTGSLRYPFAADVDGDGLDDRVFFVRKHDSSAAFEAWLASGLHLTFAAGHIGSDAAATPFHGDFDGDAREDLGFYSTQNSLTLLLSSSAKPIASVIPGLSAGAAVPAACGEHGEDQLVLLQPQKRQVRRLSFIAGSAAVQEFEPDALPLTEEGASPVDHLAFGRLRSLRRSAGDVDNDGAANFAVWRDWGGSAGGYFYEQKSLPVAGPFPLVALDSAGSPPFVGSGFFSATDRGELFAYAGGRWSIVDAQGRVEVKQWGEKGDIPAAADYNGDGRTDAAVFRPRTGQWWIEMSSALGPPAYAVYPWGRAGDIPVPADYDGDSTADLAVYRPESGEWFVLTRTGKVQTQRLGSRQDRPVPADYTGDGRTDIALWRPATGTWYILADAQNSAVMTLQWGLPSDQPVTGDFNADGRTDPAVFRNNDGRWFIQTLDPVQPQIWTVQFGLPGDTPLGSRKDPTGSAG